MNGGRDSTPLIVLGWTALAGLTVSLHVLGRGPLGPPPLLHPHTRAELVAGARLCAGNLRGGPGTAVVDRLLPAHPVDDRRNRQLAAVPSE